MLKRLFLTILFLSGVTFAFSQLNKANIHFNNYEYIEAIPLYKKIVKRDSNIEALQRLADCYRLLKEYNDAEKIYEKVVQKKDIPPVNYFYYGIMLRNNNKPALAKEQFVKYSKLVPSDKNTNVSIRSCDEIKVWLTRPPHFEVNNVKDLNTKASEFCPLYFQNKIVFTSERGKDMVNFEVSGTNRQSYLDVYNSVYTEENGRINYSKPRPYPSPVNSDYHDGPVSFEKNGTIYITRVYNYSKGSDFVNRPKILIAPAKQNKNNDQSWDKLRDFPFNSDAYTVEHPSISADGEVLYFASDMPGGQGGTDIWVSRKAGGQWQKPENLGEEINTSGNEKFPFIRSDEVLYFSSDGQPGFGGLDIFSAVSENNKWTKVSNLGLPLNSSTDDFGITFSENMQKGYFSSDRRGGSGADDIYSFSVTNKSIDVSGKVLLSEQLNDPAKNVKVFLMTEDGTVINFTTSDSLGFFRFTNLSSELKYLVKMDEDDPVLKLRKKLYLADSANKIVRVTVIDDKGRKFVFQNLPSDRNDLPLLDEGDNGLATLAGSILAGDNKKPLVNAKINLVNEAGEVIKSTITNSVGAFVFSELPPDHNYFIKLDEGDTKLPPNTKISLLTKKGDVIATTVTADKGFKFELLPADRSRLLLSKEDDEKLKMSMNGKLLSGEGSNKPLANVKIDLVNERGEVVQTVTTDADGNFNFSKLPPDRNYLIRIDEEDPKLKNLSKILLADGKGKVMNEMKNSEQGFRYNYLAADNTTLSLMNVDDSHLKFSMKGKLMNGDGSEAPVANVKVNLLNEKGEVVQTGYTDEQGNFVFSKLPADQNFYVSIDEKDNKLANIKRLLLADGSGKAINEVKSDSKGEFKFQFLSADSRSHSLMEVEEAQLKSDLLGKLLSADGSGTGMANKKVTLVNELGEVIDSTTTDANGHFEFKNLPSDKKYLVKLDEEDVALSGKLKLVLTDEKGNDLQEIQSDTNGSFEYELLKADRKLFTLFDEDGERSRRNLRGVFLAGDSLKTPVLPNSKISLYTSDDKLLQTVFTNSSGQFAFLNLPSSGNFFIKMDEKDPRLLVASRLVLTDERSVPIRDVKGKKNWIRLHLLASDLRALTNEPVDDSWNKLKLMEKKLFADVKKPEVKPPVLSTDSVNFENLYFETSSYDLSPRSRAELKKVAAFMRKTPGTMIELEGYADSRGQAKQNYYLSDYRARAAKSYLVAIGINVNRLKTTPYGATKLLNPCNDPFPCSAEHHAPNRRVEIKVIYRNKK